MARLFPELERSVREMQDFGPGFVEATGAVGDLEGNDDAAEIGYPRFGTRGVAQGEYVDVCSFGRLSEDLPHGSSSFLIA